MLTVVPQVAEWTPHGGPPFRWAADVQVVAEPAMAAVAEHLGGLPTASGAYVAIVEDATIDHPEGYTIDVSADGVRLAAATPRGAFWGVQTLLQLFPEVPAGRIVDQPRYRWRGLMLDVSRHLMPVEAILRLIDTMAAHKLNTFHWHLTDDQGWRIESRRYPRLTDVGGWRPGADGVLTPGWSTDAEPARTGRYGGFYTHDDVRRVVAHAAARHVRRRARDRDAGPRPAALAAYPELACTGPASPTPTDWGVFPDVYCAGNEHVRLPQDVLTRCWRCSPAPTSTWAATSARRRGGRPAPSARPGSSAEGLKDEHELQSYVIQRMRRFLAARAGG